LLSYGAGGVSYMMVTKPPRLATRVNNTVPYTRIHLMADLVVIAYPSEAKAEEVRQKLLGHRQLVVYGMAEGAEG
jgi:hypothetical protein